MSKFASFFTLLSAVTGFAGGYAAQLDIPPNQRPHRRSAATEVDAQRFVLVDSTGLVTGEIKMNEGEPEIILYDKQGQIAWRATTHQHGLRPVVARR